MSESKSRRNVQVKVRLPVELHRSLSAIGAATGDSLSAVIRRALAQEFERMKHGVKA